MRICMSSKFEWKSLIATTLAKATTLTKASSKITKSWESTKASRKTSLAATTLRCTWSSSTKEHFKNVIWIEIYSKPQKTIMNSEFVINKYDTYLLAFLHGPNRLDQLLNQTFLFSLDHLALSMLHWYSWIFYQLLPKK